jgi:hypothetical protein
MKHDIWEMITIFFICVLFIAIMYAVIDTVSAQPTSISVPSRTEIGPPIAQCNKELWLRIKDGCDD